MQQISDDKPSSTKRKPASAWSVDDLADDVTTLSYESALRTHSRYRSSGLADRSLTQAGDAGLNGFEDSEPAATPQPAARPAAYALPTATVEHSATLFERNVKDASITIRLSKAECEQLHRRAAEAGLTVSAYMRSCTFEAESLRAMVKEAMTQLRAATTPASVAKPASSHPSWLRSAAHWPSRLLTPRQSSRSVARV
jgi:hypothetical protein